LAESLSLERGWAKDFKDLRDPVAHRVPLYAVPGVITSEAGVDQFRALDREATDPAHRGDFNEFTAKRTEASHVGQYQPIFACSSPSGYELRRIPEQIDLDQGNFLDVSEEVVGAILGL
jgi:hypothetical protein